MATEQPLPYDLQDSNDLGRFTHVAPSTLSDSEHEVLVEADSDSDVPVLKSRKDKSSSSLPINGHKKGPVVKKKSPPSVPLPNPIMSEDMVYHLMDQNKTLMDQNKVLTQRLEPSDPFPIFPRDEIPVVHERPVPDPPHFQPCPEPFLPDFAQPVMKRKSKDASEDKLYDQCKELWDVLPRVLRLLEAAAPPPPSSPSANSSMVKFDQWGIPYYDDPFAQYLPPLYESGASHEERMFAISKDTFLKGLAEAERRFGISPKSKKYGKKAKPKTDDAKFKMFDRNDLMPYAWKALGLLQNFLLIFVMIQLSLVGGDVFHFFKKSPKNSSWLGF
jgi:hypothetical protein